MGCAASLLRVTSFTQPSQASYCAPLCQHPQRSLGETAEECRGLVQCSEGQNHSEVFKIVLIRGEGQSQVFGAVQLTVPSLPAMQREREGMGEMGREHEDKKRCAGTNRVPLCF